MYVCVILAKANVDLGWEPRGNSRDPPPSTIFSHHWGWEFSVGVGQAGRLPAPATHVTSISICRWYLANAMSSHLASVLLIRFAGFSSTSDSSVLRVVVVRVRFLSSSLFARRDICGSVVAIIILSSLSLHVCSLSSTSRGGSALPCEIIASTISLLASRVTT